MGPYLLGNAVLVGFFAFAALHYLCLWWLSRRERALLIFALHCLLCAGLTLCLLAIATASNIEACQAALNGRTTLGLLAVVTTLSVMRLISGLRADHFIGVVAAICVSLAIVNLAYFPINGTVTALGATTLPWGEVIVVPQHGRPGWWLWPVYALILSVGVYGLSAAWFYSRKDRVAGLIMALASGGSQVSVAIAMAIDLLDLDWPYAGVLPYALWVALIALLLSREYGRRGEQIAARDRQFRAIFDQTFQFIGLLSVEGKVLEANRTALEFAGVEAEDVLGRPFWECPWWTHSAELQTRLQAAIRAAAAGEMVRFEATHWGADGKLHAIDFSLKPVRDEQGRVAFLIPEGRDITAVKEAQAALWRTGELMRAVVEGTADCVFAKDREGRYLFINPALSRITGLRPEDVIGKDDTQIFSPAIAERIIERDRKILATGAGDTVEDNLEVNGRRFTLLSSKSPYRDAEGRIVGVVGIATDITERNRLADQLRQSQKMDAVGQLAGGVAHDFNNLLTVINGYSDLLLTTIPADHSMRAELEQIQNAGERAAALTKQLLAFSRRTMREVKVIGVNLHVTRAEQILRRLIGEDIQLSVLLDAQLDRIQADASQIDQVLLNLALNARDAMPRGGKLTISTSNVRIDSASQHAPHAAAGNYVTISVADTGCGMSSELQEHIFEPFFTTKEPGQGTGLGLSVVHGIVQQSGGFVHLASKPGEGTTFQIAFKAIDAPPPSPSPEPREHFAALPLAGSETVLLVEDEQAVRDIAQVALASHGYRVLTAGSGQEALDLAARHAEPIDILLTDVIMPGISGRTLSDALCEHRRDLKVLYMSGYTSDTALRHGLLQGDVNFIQKPFKPSALIYKIRQILNG